MGHVRTVRASYDESDATHVPDRRPHGRPLRRSRRRFTAWPLLGTLTGLLGLVSLFSEARPDENGSGFDYPVTAEDAVSVSNEIFRVAGVTGYLTALLLLVFAAVWHQRVGRRFTGSTGATMVTFSLVATAALVTLAFGWRGALGNYLPGGPEENTYDTEGLYNYYVMNDFSPYIAFVPLLGAAYGLAWMAFRESLVSKPLGAGRRPPGHRPARRPSASRACPGCPRSSCSADRRRRHLAGRRPLRDHPGTIPPDPSRALSVALVRHCLGHAGGRAARPPAAARGRGCRGPGALLRPLLARAPQRARRGTPRGHYSRYGRCDSRCTAGLAQPIVRWRMNCDRVSFGTYTRKPSTAVGRHLRRGLDLGAASEILLFTRSPGRSTNARTVPGRRGQRRPDLGAVTVADVRHSP